MILRALLARGTSQSLLDQARRAGIAVAFRRADGLLGPLPLDQRLVDDLHVLVEESFQRSAALIPEAWRHLAEYRLELEDGAGAAEAYLEGARAGELDCVSRAAATIWEF